MTVVDLPLDLTAGGWSLTLQPDGSVSHVTFRGDEILQGVRFVLRDANWDTIAGEVAVSLERDPRGATAHVSSRHTIDSATFAGEGDVEIDESGITLTLRGSTLDVGCDTNRAGFVLLHPLSLAGTLVTVAHADGSATSTSFPLEVAPHQPFRDVAGFAHAAPSGDTVRIALEGDVFETEDQRNWSDPSYKTYSRPLDLPFPYRIEPGDVVEQSVRIWSRTLGRQTDRRPIARETTGSPPYRGRPAVGVALGPDDDPARALELAAELGLDHVRVDVVAGSDGLRGLERLASVATGSVPIELAVHVGRDPDLALRDLAASLERLERPLDAVAIYDATAPATTARALEAATSVLAPWLTGVPLLVGTDDNFAELNRHRPDPRWHADAATFSLNPQVHDFDDEAVLHTVESYDAIVRTGLTFAPALAVGFLSLRPRRNIYLDREIDRLGRDPSSIDPRQHDDFAGVWLDACLWSLAASGVSRITALEFEGGRGLLDPATRAFSPVARTLAQYLAEPR